MSSSPLPACPAHRRWSQSRQGGMTLVELMLSMAISSMLLVLLASMLQSSLSAYSGQQRRISSTVESRAGLEILRGDLRSSCSVARTAPDTVDDGLTRFIHVPAAGQLGSDRIAFLRRTRMAGTGTIATAADLGHVVLVAYAVGFTPDAGGRSSQKLYRRQFTPEETYVKMRDFLQLDIPLLSEKEWKAVANPQAVEADEAADPTLATSVSEPIVFQVIQFKVKPLQALLTRADDPGSLNGVATLPAGTPWPESKQPAAVDVLLRVTNRATAAKLDTEADWRGEGNYKFLLLGRPATPSVYEDDPEVETQQLRIHLPRF